MIPLKDYNPTRRFPILTVALILLNVAAVIRGILPAIFPERLLLFVELSGSLWIAAFAIFIAIYAPILIQPRIDGRPG